MRLILKQAALVLALFSVVSCTKAPREKAVHRLRVVGGKRLRHDAALLYKNLFASAAPEFSTLKASSWPESFHAMSPLSVGIYADGFSLAYEQNGGAESGIYIVPIGMDLKLANRGRAHFEPIEEGLYWYSFTSE